MSREDQLTADERTEQTAQRVDEAAVATAATCALCEQRVSGAETVPVDVDGTRSGTMCTFCASSLFETDVAATAEEDPSRVDVSGGRGAEAESAAEGTTAGDVRWSPPAPSRARGGLVGTLSRAHHRSLTLLWAIHRTNVRLAERVLDEVDVERLALAAIAASTLVWVVVALA